MVDNFQVIRRSGAAVLVEYTDADGRLRRVTIPVGAVTDKGVCEDTLAAGIEYGCDWEAALVNRVTPEHTAEALRRAGFWTKDDVKADPMRAANVLAKQALHLGELLAAIETMEVKRNG
jgi:hypothetical protein